MKYDHVEMAKALRTLADKIEQNEMLCEVRQINAIASLTDKTGFMPGVVVDMEYTGCCVMLLYNCKLSSDIDDRISRELCNTF